jgi:hypothetical protein
MVDLLVLTSSDKLLFMLELYFSFLQNNLSKLRGQPYFTLPFNNNSLTYAMVSLQTSILRLSYNRLT